MKLLLSCENWFRMMKLISIVCISYGRFQLEFHPLECFKNSCSQLSVLHYFIKLLTPITRQMFRVYTFADYVSVFKFTLLAA